MLEDLIFEKGWLLPALFCGVTFDLYRDRISIGVGFRYRSRGGVCHERYLTIFK